jgi:hypothetical protein
MFINTIIKKLSKIFGFRPSNFSKKKPVDMQMGFYPKTISSGYSIIRTMTPGEHISGLKVRDIPTQGKESMMDFEPYEAVIWGKGTIILSV